MNTGRASKEVKIPLASLDGAVVTGLIRVRNICKKYGKTLANQDISFDIKIGTIHSIVGQNGAGKSTLMKIIFGLESPDSGSISLGEELLEITSPRDSLAMGIGLLQQEFSLIEDLTAIENLILGNEPMKLMFIDFESAVAKAKELQEKLNLHIPWDEKISTLSIAQKQQVEILRLLAYGANVLILDEPTAVLAPLQIDALMDLLSILKREGKTIVYISHKLREVMQISDYITVLRDGCHVDTLAISDANADSIANMIVGNTYQKGTYDYGNPQKMVLQVKDLFYRNSKNMEKVKKVSLNVHSHSIIGICGVAGNGQEEFMQLLAGISRPNAGSIVLADMELINSSVRERRKAGIAYVSPDRKSEGLASVGSLIENATGGFQFALAKFSWLRKAILLQHTQGILKRFDVTHGELDSPVSTLSGGNQQKLMVGREIMHNPQVLLASQPSRGVDLGGVEKIHEFIREARDGGTAIVLASEDLDELLELCDEIAVFYNGEVFATFHQPYDRNQIGSAMLGISAYAS